MKKHKLEQFWQRLERQREEILRSLSRVQTEVWSQELAYPQDVGELSVTSFTKDLLFQEGAQKRRQLRNIDVALERIRDGTFGECLRCGNEINLKRLEVVPFAACCRECQENIEGERFAFSVANRLEGSTS